MYLVDHDHDGIAGVWMKYCSCIVNMVKVYTVSKH